MSKSIAEEFANKFSEVPEEVIEQTTQAVNESTTSGIIGMLNNTGAKTVEALAFQVGVTAATAATNAMLRSCQRRRQGQEDQGKEDKET